MSILGIGIDGGLILSAFIEEVQLNTALVPVLVTFASDEPVVCALGLAGHGDVVGGGGFQILGIVPVTGHIADELEGGSEVGALIVLGQVGSHLQRRVHGQVEGELAADGGTHPGGVVAPRAELGLEDAGRVVHGSALQTGEGQDAGVVGAIAAECLVLRAASALVADEVGIGAAETGGAHCLVGIDHDVVAGRLLDAIEVVVVHGLRVVVVAARDDVADVAALYGIVAVPVHQLVGILHVALVVLGAGTGLVVHHQLHAFAVGIVVERLDVEIGIGCHEVKDVPFPHVGPVLPAHVPSFHQHLVKTVGSCEVNVTAHLLVVGGVAAVGSGELKVES